MKEAREYHPKVKGQKYQLLSPTGFSPYDVNSWTGRCGDHHHLRADHVSGSVQIFTQSFQQLYNVSNGPILKEQAIALRLLIRTAIIY